MKEKPLKQKWYSPEHTTVQKLFISRPLTLCIASIRNFFLLSPSFFPHSPILLNVAVPDCVLYVSIIEMENRFIWLIIFLPYTQQAVCVERGRCVPTMHSSSRVVGRAVSGNRKLCLVGKVIYHCFLCCFLDVYSIGWGGHTVTVYIERN